MSHALWISAIHIHWRFSSVRWQKSPTYFLLSSARRRKDTHAFRIIFKSISALGVRLSSQRRASRMQRESESWTTAGDYQVRLLYLVCRYLRVSSVHTLSFSLYTAQQRQIYICFSELSRHAEAQRACTARKAKNISSVSAACIILALYIPHRRIICDEHNTTRLCFHH